MHKFIDSSVIGHSNQPSERFARVFWNLSHFSKLRYKGIAALSIKI